MTEIVARSIDPSEIRPLPAAASRDYTKGLRMAAICIILLLINVFSQIDRILPFILAEKIKADLSLRRHADGPAHRPCICRVLRTPIIAACPCGGSGITAAGAGVLRFDLERHDDTRRFLPPVSCSWPSHASVSHSERQAQYRRVMLSSSAKLRRSGAVLPSVFSQWASPWARWWDLRQAARLQMYSAGASF